MSNSRTLFIDSSELLDDPIELRARAMREGYLFFRGLLPKADVLHVRADELAVIEQHGWRQPKQDALGGLIDVDALNQVPESAMRTDIGVSSEAYCDVQKLASMHRLPHHPRLVALYRTLFESEVLVHPRHIARMITPHQCMTPAPPHQDFPLIQGTRDTWTAWIPLGDYPRECGPLTVCRQSHQLGVIPFVHTSGAGGIAAQLCPDEQDWVEGDFLTGDVLTFPSLTVHRALKSHHKNQIRLSLDVRYQSLAEEVEEKSLLPHCDLSWEQIYDGWSSDDLKYYWRRLPLNLSPWDDTIVQPKRRIC
jgi:ectoine hydroxylase-related dioxygenase (phytanoyl-CoA dioxygenase family)